MTSTNTLRRVSAALAAAGIALTAVGALAGAAGAAPKGPTVADTKATGCNPSFSIGAGERTIRYGAQATWQDPAAQAAGKAACVAHPATLIHDRTPGVDDAVTIVSVFDLGAGTFTVPAGILCGQADVFNGDVTGEINAPGWSPANRLWTAVKAPTIPACAEEVEATTTTVAVTTTPAPTTTAPVNVDDELPPPTVTTFHVDEVPERLLVTASVPAAVAVPMTELPFTGPAPEPWRQPKTIAVVGACLALVGFGVRLVGPRTHSA